MHHQYLLQTLAGYLQCCTAVFLLWITLIRGVPGLWSCLHTDVWNPDPRKWVAKLSLTVSIISSKTLLFTANKELLQSLCKVLRGSRRYCKQQICHHRNSKALASKDAAMAFRSGWLQVRVTVLKNLNQSVLNYAFGHFLEISLLSVMKIKYSANPDFWGFSCSQQHDLILHITLSWLQGKEIARDSKETYHPQRFFRYHRAALRFQKRQLPS